MHCHMQERQDINNKHKSLCILQRFLNNLIQQDKIQLKKRISIHLQVNKLKNHCLNHKKPVAEKVKNKKLLKDFKKVKTKNKLIKNQNNILKIHKNLQNNLPHSQHQNLQILQIEFRVKEMSLKVHLRKNHKFLNFKLKNKQKNQEYINYKMIKYN